MSQPDARALPRAVFVWRRVAGSVRRLRGSGGERRHSEPTLIEKFELRADVVWQCTLAAFHDDRQKSRWALVDQPRADCVGRRRSTARWRSAAPSGRGAALDLVEQLVATEKVETYPLLPSVRGDLLLQLGHVEEARDEFRRAATMTRNVCGRALLLRRGGDT